MELYENIFKENLNGSGIHTCWKEKKGLGSIIESHEQLEIIL